MHPTVTMLVTVRTSKGALVSAYGECSFTKGYENSFMVEICL